MRHTSRWVLMASGIVALCLVAGLLVAHFVGGETKIERRIERRYTLDDPRFMHELGVLLGPPFLCWRQRVRVPRRCSADPPAGAARACN